jgi:uncharacterized membrane protein YozB (DUF420 family)
MERPNDSVAIEVITIAAVLTVWVCTHPIMNGDQPMILITFFLSPSGRFPAHRRLARFTFPVWLYISVSGVIVYAMLAAYR